MRHNFWRWHLFLVPLRSPVLRRQTGGGLCDLYRPSEHPSSRSRDWTRARQNTHVGWGLHWVLRLVSWLMHTVLVSGRALSWRTAITLWRLRYVWHRWSALRTNKKAGSGKWQLCFQEVCGLPSLSIRFYHFWVSVARTMCQMMLLPPLYSNYANSFLHSLYKKTYPFL